MSFLFDRIGDIRGIRYTSVQHMLPYHPSDSNTWYNRPRSSSDPRGTARQSSCPRRTVCPCLS